LRAKPQKKNWSLARQDRSSASSPLKVMSHHEILKNQPRAQRQDDVWTVTCPYLHRLCARQGVEGALAPQASLCALDLDGGAWVLVGPGGTEPKLKTYVDLSVSSPPIRRSTRVKSKRSPKRTQLPKASRAYSGSTDRENNRGARIQCETS
jgi:hypothetical protein